MSLLPPNKLKIPVLVPVWDRVEGFIKDLQADVKALQDEIPNGVPYAGTIAASAEADIGINVWTNIFSLTFTSRGTPFIAVSWLNFVNKTNVGIDCRTRLLVNGTQIGDQTRVDMIGVAGYSAGAGNAITFSGVAGTQYTVTLQGHAISNDANVIWRNMSVMESR